MTNCCVGTYNLCINQYATYTKIFTWLASSCGCGTVGASPLPVDLTGYTGSMQFRQSPYSSTILYDATSDLVLGGTAGTITLTIPASATALFTWWTGVYDLILTDGSGNVTRLLEGTVNVSPGVTP
jgi:hypothetical protein